MQVFCNLRKGVSEMPNRSMVAMIALTVGLACSPAVFGQSGPQKAMATAVSNKPFDPHDLSGFWDITKTGLPSGALNETSNNRPQMTPWALEKFRKTKTGPTGTSLSNGFSANEKDWNDPIRWCDPVGFPRVL